MLLSTLVTQAQLFANDTDATNPFVSTTNIYLLIDDWMADLASYLKYPRYSQTIAFAQGDGPNGVGGITNPKNLNQDMMCILSVHFENTTTGIVKRLKPKTEVEMQNLYPTWRYNTVQAIPSYYVILDTPTVGTTDFAQQTITVDMPNLEARTMRIHYITAPTSGGSVNSANSPLFPPNFHKSGVYYVASQMLLPRNAQKSAFYAQMYERERAKQKSLMMEQIDPATEIWDMYQIPGYPQMNILTRNG